MGWRLWDWFALAAPGQLLPGAPGEAVQVQDAGVARVEADFATGFDRDDRERAAVSDRREGLLQFRRIPGRQHEDLSSRAAGPRHLALQVDYALAVEIEGGRRAGAGAEVFPSSAEGRLVR